MWKVFAAKSKDDFHVAGKVSQGSAVAISGNTLLTNCHVIAGRAVVVIKHGAKADFAKIISGSQGSDRCVLRADHLALEPISGIRSYASLKVGEKTYTIGSPSGFENTLGEGIVSGLRNENAKRLVQTTAPISPGSSGGGLFDAGGKLIGITSFLLRNAEALNFAIPVEEYGK